MRSRRTRLKVTVMRWPRAYAWVRRGVILARYLARRPHDPDFRAFAEAPQTGLFLDVGANSGLSALSFRTQNKHMPILSIEANRLHEPDLKFLRHVLRRFDYRIVAAAEGEDDLVLHVPVYHGVPLTGEASLLEITEENMRWWAEQHFGHPVPYDVRDVPVRAIPLDDLELDPTIVKIDVEGFEFSVLKGLERTLDRCHPLLLLEWPSAADFDAISDYLAQWGYEPRRCDADGHLIPLVGHSTNIFYEPPGWGHDSDAAS